MCLNLLRWDHYSDIMYVYIYIHICIWVTVDVQAKVWLLACWWQHSPQQHGFHTLVMCCVHHHCLFYIGVVLHSLRDTKAGYVPLFPGPNCFSPSAVPLTQARHRCSVPLQLSSATRHQWDVNGMGEGPWAGPCCTESWHLSRLSRSLFQLV